MLSYRFTRRSSILWFLTFLLLISCSTPDPITGSFPNPTPASVPLDPFPTPTAFQPGANTDQALVLLTPQTAPTFTPYPTKYVIAQGVDAPIDTTPAYSAVIYYNPLTGLPVSDPSFLQRRPLAIKIANSPDYVRPQSGLTLADVVYEYYIEWGDTRFIAIFYSNSNNIK
ncbi:MAG: hypothetical protein RIR73_2437, partial [Chloroflexota bacterium]